MCRARDFFWLDIADHSFDIIKIVRRVRLHRLATAAYGNQIAVGATQREPALALQSTIRKYARLKIKFTLASNLGLYSFDHL